MQEILHLINEMSPYLLLGFLFAGILHAFVPQTQYNRYLGKNSFSSVVNAAILGIPLPLCSCGVIPTALSLRRNGASKGATVSFLIATPQTGVDSIAATYSLMGLPFALVRPLAALCTSLLGGALANFTNKDVDSCQECRESSETETSGTFLEKCVEALRFGYVDMMQDIGKWLVTGLVVAALITILVPDNFFTIFNGNTLASMLLVFAIALPMYVCATGSIPIAVALMMKGLTPGAALVLLMAGPACNFASMIAVRKVLGMKTMLIYIFSVMVGAMGFGFLIDHLQFSGSVDFMEHLAAGHSCHVEAYSIQAWLASGTLLVLLINALIVPKFRKNRKTCCAKHSSEGTGCDCNLDMNSDCNLGMNSDCNLGMNVEEKKGVSSNDDTETGIEEKTGMTGNVNSGMNNNVNTETGIEEKKEMTGKVKENNMEMKVYHIEGMNCNHCRMTAEKTLKSVEGVTNATVDLASKEAHVEGTATKEELAKAISEIGFTLI